MNRTTVGASVALLIYSTLAHSTSAPVGPSQPEPHLVTDAVALNQLLDAPAIALGHGPVSVKLYLPDAQHGFYRGARFDWAGIIGSLTYGGHDFYVPWYRAVSPSVRDYVFQNGIVINSENNATGPAEEFNADGGALGYERAPPGGEFLKIGVGILRRIDASPYDKLQPYPIINSGQRRYVAKPDRVDFIQDISSPTTGYGYHYVKTIRIEKNRPVMLIEHVLENRGSKAISTRVSNHNFLNIDDAGTPVGLEFDAPFQIAVEKPLDAEVAAVRGRQIVFRAAPAPGQVVVSTLTGYGSTSADNQFHLMDPSRGVGVCITGDRPLAHLLFWSIQPVTAVEPVVEMTIAPGQSFKWSYRYEFQTKAEPCSGAGTMAASTPSHDGAS